MRIVWLSHGARVGGATLALAEGVEALVARGHDIHVMLPEEGPLRQHLVGATVHVIHSNPWMGRTLPSLSVRARQIAFNIRRAAPRIADLARDVDADVLMTNTVDLPSGAFAARRARRPHVWYIHEYGDLDHGRAFHWGRAASAHVIGRLSARVLVNSEALRRHWSRWIAESKLRLAQYAVKVQAPTGSSSPSSGPLRLVLVGDKTLGKGQKDAVNAVALLAERGLCVTLDLVGGGDPAYEAELRRVVSEKKLTNQVRFVDFTSDPFSPIAGADIALMCSRSEAFGRVTVEAMKLGKPVIGANAGATPELVRDGENGALYVAGDAGDLAGKIERMGRDRTVIAAMGERACRWATAQFNLERYGGSLEQSVSEAAGRRKTLG